jgi:(p)ppGpp synthase/HD superfamily hydrolase
MTTSRLADAFAFANELHCAQTRKGTAIPYVSHLMSVSALVLEAGGDEDQAIAGLLHDAVEDQGGLPVAQEIERRFGRRVAELVLACTDAMPAAGEDKAPWRERKLAYIDHLPGLSPDAALVVACDKLHNLRCLLSDIERDGPATLERFNEPEAIEWYYSSVASALNGVAPAALTNSLGHQVHRLSQMLRADSAEGTDS